MKIELLLFGILPAAAGAVALCSSLYLTIRTQRYMQTILSLLVVPAVLWSLIVLYNIFIGGAWPTYLPHIVIGIAVVLTTLQVLIRPVKVGPRSQQE